MDSTAGGSKLYGTDALWNMRGMAYSIWRMVRTELDGIDANDGLMESARDLFPLVSIGPEVHSSQAPMKFLQRFLMAIFPKAWGELMRADSERWKYQCLTCGSSRSVWDAGEIRWNTNTVGKKLFKWCPSCRRLRWSVLEYHPEGGASDSVPGVKAANKEKLIP